MLHISNVVFNIILSPNNPTSLVYFNLFCIITEQHSQTFDFEVEKHNVSNMWGFPHKHIWPIKSQSYAYAL
jgi:hypothetical protein